MLQFFSVNIKFIKIAVEITSDIKDILPLKIRKLMYTMVIYRIVDTW